jgi:hypothetical protein
MSPTPKPLLALIPLVLALVPAAGADLPDLSKIDRTIRKEPSYTAKSPLYGLAVFGLKAESRVWMVLDKSKPDADGYDVLHIDLNADGDLTGAGERLKIDDKGLFHVKEFKDPATGVKHPDFSVRLSKDKEPTVMLGMRWRDQFTFGGGYPEDPDDGYMRFAAKPADAPIIWVNGDAPFRFQRWYGGKLRIGDADDFKVFLGQPGIGRSSFCAFKQHFLPEGEWVKATLIYRDGTGKEKRQVCELKERC